MLVYTISLAGAARELADVETRYLRLGQQARISKEETSRLKEEIRGVAKRGDVHVNDEELLSAIEQIIEKTGDLKFARENILNIGRAISASGARGSDIGSIVAEFQKLGVVVDKDVQNALDTFIRQGDEGAFTLQKLATQGERVFGAFSSIAKQGPESIRALGALLQVAKQGTGSAEEAATSFTSLISDILTKQKDLLRLGVQIFDPEKLKEGKEELRDLPALLAEIIVKANGRMSIINKLFGEQSAKIMRVLLGEYNQKGKLESLQKFNSIQGDGVELQKRSNEAAQSLSSTWSDIKNRAVEFVDAVGTPVLQKAADTFNESSDTTKDVAVGSGVVAGVAATGAGVVSGIAAGSAAAAVVPAAVVAGGTLAAAGVALGINNLIDEFDRSFGTAVGNAIGEAVARALAGLGSKDAKLAIEINEGRIRKIKATGDITAEVKNGSRRP